MLGSKEREKERLAAKRKAQALAQTTSQTGEPSSARKKIKGSTSIVEENDVDEPDVFGSRRSGSGSVAPEPARTKKPMSVAVSVKEETAEPDVEMAGSRAEEEDSKTDATVPPSSGRKKVNPQETHNKAVSTYPRCITIDLRSISEYAMPLCTGSTSRRLLYKPFSSVGSPRTTSSSRRFGTGSSGDLALHSCVSLLLYPFFLPNID